MLQSIQSKWVTDKVLKNNGLLAAAKVKTNGKSKSKQQISPLRRQMHRLRSK
jgi:hypothetical protein